MVNKMITVMMMRQLIVEEEVRGAVVDRATTDRRSVGTRVCGLLSGGNYTKTWKVAEKLRCRSRFVGAV